MASMACVLRRYGVTDSGLKATHFEWFFCCEKNVLVFKKRM
jgi:hypothetical protein